MKNANQIAGKFDIVKTTNEAQLVVEHALPFDGQPEWMGMFGCVDIETGRETLVYGRDIAIIVSRHPDNIELDHEYSDLAKSKNHAFDQMRLELV